jgi:dynein heavy chain
MESSEGELVKMSRIVNPQDAKGAVERWLLQVQQIMFETVRDQCAKALAEYPSVPRSQWVLKWPSQVRRRNM